MNGPLSIDQQEGKLQECGHNDTNSHVHTYIQYMA